MLVNALLLYGSSIALPDHLGPTSAYGAARLGGQITLDGIRAVRQVPELEENSLERRHPENTDLRMAFAE